MMANRKLLIFLLCPLFVVTSVMLIQGCGGGNQTQEAEETAKEAAGDVTKEAKEAVDESEAAMESLTEDLVLMGYVCPMHPAEVSLEPGRCSQCGMDLNKAGVYYTCEHCGGKMMTPGKCACGMDMVLRAEVKKPETGAAH